MVAVVYFTKNEKVSGTIFCTFSTWFYLKHFPYLMLYELTVSMSYHFSVSKYQAKCFIKFLFIQLMIYLQSSSKAMTDSEKSGEEFD